MFDESWSPQEIKEWSKVVKNNMHMTTWTLKKMCMRTIIVNRSYFINTAPEDGSKLLEDLPPALKDDIFVMTRDCNHYTVRIPTYQLDVSEMTDLYLFLTKILNSKITSIDLPFCKKWMTPNIEGLLDMMMAIGQKCPDLTSIAGSFNMTEPPPLTECQWFPIGFFKMTTNLNNLKIVNFEKTRCDDWTLQQFASNCPKLEELTLLVNKKVTKVGIEALKQLRFLRLFYFGPHPYYYDWSAEVDATCLHLALHYLPHLRTIGHRFNVQQHTLKPELYSYHNKLNKFAHVELGLEEIALSGNVTVPTTCKLPNLKSLHLYKAKGDIISFCARFTALDYLGLYKMNVRVSNSLLKAVGHRLCKLSLVQVDTSIRLDEVFTSCPNLEELFLMRSKIDNRAVSISEEQLKKFHTLTVDDSDFEQVFPPGFALQVLSAPLLKTIFILRSYLLKTECMQLIKLIQQKRIFQKLEDYTWITIPSYCTLDSRLSSKDDMALLNTTMCCMLPKFGQYY